MTTLRRGSLHTHADAEELSSDVARVLCDLVVSQSASPFTLALAGGSTPRRLYECLARDPRMPWSRLELFWGDERAVSPDSERSNYRLVADTILRSVHVPEHQVHRIRAERPDADLDYERELGRVFGIGPHEGPPSLDLVLLGMGADGHTASLFPGSNAVHEEHRWVMATRASGTGDRRYTLTPPVLRAARRVFVLVAGAAKAPALQQVLEGPMDIDRWPAQVIAEQAQWFVDAAAAAQLDNTKTAGS